MLTLPCQLIFKKHFVVNKKQAIDGLKRYQNIKWVEFYASNNNSNWEKIGASDFNDEFIRETFRYYVKSTTARYLKLVIPEGHGNACPPAAIRELTVFGY